MHVCFLCNEYPPAPHGGIGSFTQTLARVLVRRGHEVTVVGFDSSPSNGADEGVRIRRLPRSSIPKSGFLVHSARLASALKELDRLSTIDVVEGSESSLALAPKRLKAPKVVRMHGGHRFFATELGDRTHAWAGWLERRSFARADHLLAVSEYVARTTSRLLGIDRPVTVIPNPVDTKHFRPAPERDVNRGVIAFVGTITKKKGVRQLLEAMPRIVQAVPGAHLWIVGRDSESGNGSYSEELRGEIPSSIEGRVTFKGGVDHSRLPETLAPAEVCVYPSMMEALPVAWLEAMAMGKAVVASRLGPGPEVIDDGVTGLLCDPSDPSSIAESVIKVLTDVRLRRELGARAEASVRERFDSELLATKNEDFYRRVAGARLG